MHSSNFEITKEFFHVIKRDFPNLFMDLDENPEHVEISMIIPKQAGLDFDIHLNLQNEDELHMSSEPINFQVFPLDEETTEKFKDYLYGLINGKYRVHQYLRNDTVLKAFLQMPEQGKWITIYRAFNKIYIPWLPFKKRIIVNTAPNTT